MPVPDAAVAHYAQRVRLASGLVAEARRMWLRLDVRDLDRWYARNLRRLVVLLMGAQTAAAAAADAYLDDVLGEQGISPSAAGFVEPAALAGAAADGRPLAGLFRSPIVAAKLAAGRGASPRQVAASGWANLEMLLRTEVADAGRVADGVALTARRNAAGYVRMVNPPCCARCAVLAGRWYGWSAGFQRHPSCACVHVPSQEDRAGDMRTSPKALFESGEIQGLSRAESQAVRDGADMGRVVNVKRSGIGISGGRRTTRELTGRRRGTARPTPEQIYRDAEDRQDAVRLLKRFGYLR